MIEPDCFRPASATRRSAALLGLALCVVLAGCDKSAPKSEPPASAPAASASATGEAAIAIKTPIQKDTGFAWIVKTDVNPAVRKLHVYENGKVLGPADSIHDDIRKKGLGASSHWDAKDQGYLVYFSTSDNSDPNTNGRTYELR